jgi:DNA-binding NarL/FixJ family response regulator
VNKPVRLVIADDSEIVRRAIVQVISTCCEGVAVVGLATDVGSLLQTIETARPDVVLVDLNMHAEVPVEPELLQAHLGAACLLVMSAYFDEPRAERARAYGAAELLEKGKLAETLQPAIERCMGPKWRAAGQ